jgi:hypothetical protein
LIEVEVVMYASRIQNAWIVIAFNGRFQVSRSEARRVLKSDYRNSYFWEETNCEVLLWGTEDYVPGDGVAVKLEIHRDYY